MSSSSAPTDEPTFDEDALKGPGALVTLGGLGLSAAGFLQAAAGAQLVSSLSSRYLLVEIWMWVLMGLGVMLVPLGFGFSQARRWANLPAPLVAIFSVLLGGAWQLYAMFNGVLTAASFTGTALGFVATVLALVSLPRALRVAKARRALIASI